MLQPKLRFKTFNDKWNIKQLRKVLEFKNGINASKEQYGKGIKFINVLDILNNDFITYDNIIGKVNIDKNLLEKYSVSYGDILFQRSSETREEVGMANVYLDKNKIATFGGFVIRGKKIGSYEPYFMNKLLQTNLVRNEIISKAGGSTRYNVGQDILSEVKIIIPSIQEQKKIADFLSSVDVRIDLTNQKLELFEKYKKGIMQKIFKQELRFKDSNGNDYPEWEEKRLGDLITSQGGKALEKYSNDNGKYKFISIGNYSENSTFIDNGKRIDLNSETKKQLLRKNELVMILNDKTKTGNIIGRTLLIEKDDTYIYNQRSQRIICKKDFLPQFAYVLLNSSYRNNIIQNAQGGTQIYINFSTIENFSIELPCLEEQQKIADFLSSIDNKIEKIADELENLKEFKKGLLQQMFV